MNFVEDDIYAYAAAELLFPRHNRRPETAGCINGSLARAHRRAWIMAVLFFTLALQCGTFALVAFAPQGGGCQGLDVPTWGMGWSVDLKGNLARVDLTLRNCYLPTLEQWITLQGMLAAYEPKSQPACVEGHEKFDVDACDRLTEVHVNAMKRLSYIDGSQNDPRTQLAVALALMAIIINVHRELIRAAVLARIVMSHTGWMPPFFAPLLVQNEEQPAKQLNGIERFVMLLLPLLQMGTCFLAWMAAIKSFAGDANKGQIVTVIINSVAVLFVLELDNYVCTMMKETDALRHNNSTGQPAVLAKRELTLTSECAHKPNKVWRHWYALIIGCGWLMIPAATVFALLLVYEDSMYEASIIAKMLLGLYLAVVFLLFEPPLLPRDNSCVWRWCHKGCMLGCAAVAMTFLVTVVISDTWTLDAYDALIHLTFVVPAAAGLGLFFLWPYFAARKQQQTVGIPQQLAAARDTLPPPVQQPPSSSASSLAEGQESADVRIVMQGGCEGCSSA